MSNISRYRPVRFAVALQDWLPFMIREGGHAIR